MKKQTIINKINGKEDFSYYINKDKKRYIVALKNLHTSTNPSMNYFNIYNDIYDINTDFNILGGWQDKKTKKYYVDYCNTYDNKKEAIKKAKQLKEVAIYDSKENKEILIR